MDQIEIDNVTCPLCEGEKGEQFVACMRCWKALSRRCLGGAPARTRFDTVAQRRDFSELRGEVAKELLSGIDLGSTE